MRLLWWRHDDEDHAAVQALDQERLQRAQRALRQAHATTPHVDRLATRIQRQLDENHLGDKVAAAFQAPEEDDR
ncbi:DUF7620 family protein [Terrabacter terrigena]|uniref:Uncharacterized protein n=1 Tax=Terrabacter terrigena TaxID=574718 RepID=A0ABW3MXX7_9MICO